MSKKEYMLRWREHNKEHVIEWRKKYYQAHRDEILEANHGWYTKNKETLLADRSAATLKRKLEEKHKILSEYERGFLEALIDGEGCLYVGRSSKNGRTRTFGLEISMTNKEILDKACLIIGCGSVSLDRPDRRTGKRKRSWSYTTSSNTLRWLLPQLNLIVKRERKEKMLRALSLVLLTSRYGKKTDEYYQKLEMILS